MAHFRNDPGRSIFMWNPFVQPLFDTIWHRQKPQDVIVQGGAISLYEPCALVLNMRSQNGFAGMSLVSRRPAVCGWSTTHDATEGVGKMAMVGKSQFESYVRDGDR